MRSVSTSPLRLALMLGGGLRLFPLPRFGALYCLAMPCSDRGKIVMCIVSTAPLRQALVLGGGLPLFPLPRLGKVVVRNKCGFTCPIPELTRIDFSQAANSLIVSLCQSCHSLTLPVSHSLSLPLSQSLNLPVWQASHSLTLSFSQSASL